MLNKTTFTAVRTLVHLGLNSPGRAVALREVAECLGESPTYLSKVGRHLVKAGILRAHRGVAGGVELYRDPKTITLLSIVEACEGIIVPSFCQEAFHLGNTCALHQASAQLHAATTAVLGRWTLADILRAPGPSGMYRSQVPCWLRPGGSMQDWPLPPEAKEPPGWSAVLPDETQSQRAGTARAQPRAAGPRAAVRRSRSESKTTSRKNRRGRK